MSIKYEVVDIDTTEITVDVSLLNKTEDLWFNATQMAKPFNKKVQNYTRMDSTRSYMEAVEKRYAISRNDLIRVRQGGKYQGTWMHKKLALDFCKMDFG